MHWDGTETYVKEKMGRVMGIEPTYTGTTIRGLDRLATLAVSEHYCNQDLLDSQLLFLRLLLELFWKLL